jgi:hypothetical protein
MDVRWASGRPPLPEKCTNIDLSDRIAIEEASEFVDSLFLVPSVQKIIAHLQGADGEVVRVIGLVREEFGSDPSSIEFQKLPG